MFQIIPICLYSGKLRVIMEYQKIMSLAIFIAVYVEEDMLKRCACIELQDPVTRSSNNLKGSEQGLTMIHTMINLNTGIKVLIILMIQA